METEKKENPSKNIETPTLSELEETKEISPTPEPDVLPMEEELKEIAPVEEPASLPIIPEILALPSPDHVSLKKASLIIVSVLFTASLLFLLFFPRFPSMLPGNISELKAQTEQRSQYSSLIKLSLSGPLVITIMPGVPNAIDMTEWKLVNGSGESVKIPQATKIPAFGKVNKETPLVVNTGDIIILSSGHSPIGVSFAVNKCSPYLSQFQNFNPQLPANNCPTDFYPPSSSCSAYINTMLNCRVPTDPLPGNLSSDCRSYINTHMNYNGCVADRRNDPDFYAHEWRIFLGRDNDLWNKPGTITLLDSAGKTVDTITF